MLYLLISNVAIAVCLIANIICGAKERKYLIGLLASKDYADYKLLEENNPDRKYTTPLKRREEREKRISTFNKNMEELEG